MAAVLDDIISCIDSPDRLNDEEFELILNIFSNLLSTDITLTTELTNSIASILSDAKGEHIQRYVLNEYLSEFPKKRQTTTPRSKNIHKIRWATGPKAC